MTHVLLIPRIKTLNESKHVFVISFTFVYKMLWTITMCISSKLQKLTRLIIHDISIYIVKIKTLPSEKLIATENGICLSSLINKKYTKNLFNRICKYHIFLFFNSTTYHCTFSCNKNMHFVSYTKQLMHVIKCLA